MATFNLFPAGDPPNTVVAATDTASTITSTEFVVTATCWVTQIRWYRPNTTVVTARTAQIWRMTSQTAGTTVGPTHNLPIPGTVNTWGVYTLPTPIELTPGRYKIAVRHATGRFARVASYYSSGNGGANAYVNGPITRAAASNTAPSRQSAWIASSSNVFPSTAATSGYFDDIVVTDTNPFVVQGDAAADGQGNHTDTGTPSLDVQATADGQGNHTDTGTPSFAAGAAPAGTGTAGTAGTRITSIATARSGDGGTTAAGSPRAAAATTVTGAGNTGVSNTAAAAATANRSGTGTTAATPSAALGTAASRTGTGTASTLGEVRKQHQAMVTGQGNTDVGSRPLIDTAAPTSTGAGNTTPTGRPATGQTVETSGAGTSTVTGAGIRAGTATPAGNGTTAAAGIPRTGATVVPAGTGTASSSEFYAQTTTTAGTGTTAAGGSPRPSAAAARTGTGDHTDTGTPRPTAGTARTGTGDHSDTGTPRPAATAAAGSNPGTHLITTPLHTGAAGSAGNGYTLVEAGILAPPGAPHIHLTADRITISFPPAAATSLRPDTINQRILGHV